MKLRAHTEIQNIEACVLYIKLNNWLVTKQEFLLNEEHSFMLLHSSNFGGVCHTANQAASEYHTIL
jgi:hypothetical protein